MKPLTSNHRCVPPAGSHIGRAVSPVACGVRLGIFALAFSVVSVGAASDGAAPLLGPATGVLPADAASGRQAAENVEPNVLTVSRDSGFSLKPIREIDLDISPPSGEEPEGRAEDLFAGAGVIHMPAGISRPWALYAFWWEAPATCHQPLYFEEVNLERYGYRHSMIQPAVSAAHFFATVPALPYLIAAEPPCDCVYTLGHGRPGSAVPYRIHYPPLSLKGAIAEAGVVTGLFFAIP